MTSERVTDPLTPQLPPQETRDFTKVVLRIPLRPYGTESHVFKAESGKPKPLPFSGVSDL